MSEVNTTATATETATDETNPAAPTTETTETTTTDAPKKEKVAINVDPLTDKERVSIKAEINAEIKKVKAEHTGVMKQVKAFEALARDYQGDPHLVKRVQWLAVITEKQPAELQFSKCGVAALGTAISQLANAEPIDVAIFAKEKETEEGLILAYEEEGLVKASKAVRNLKEDDLNVLNSAAHLAYFYACQFLGAVTPLPQQAADFLRFLIGVSSGSTGWFTATDTWIADVQNTSKSTIKRNRQKLIDWMNATGKGIVEMKQGTGVGTMYRLHLLEMTTKVMQNLVSGATVNIESLLIVAKASGKLLTEGVAPDGVSDDDLAAAKILSDQIKTATQSVPAPNIVMSEAAEGRKQEAQTKKFTELRTGISKAINAASEAGLDKVLDTLNKLAVEARNAQEAYEADPKQEVDYTAWTNQLSAANMTIADANRTKRAEAEAKAATEKEETGAVSPETSREIAESFVSEIASDEALNTERENALDELRSKVFLLAEIAGRSEEPDAVKQTFLACQEILKLAFNIGV